jgi:hypothetical protein
MSAIIAVAGCGRWFWCYSLSSVLSLMSMRLCYRVVLLISERDAAGHTDALEIPLLLSSDVIVANVELDQRPFGLWCGGWTTAIFFVAPINQFLCRVLLQKLVYMVYILSIMLLIEGN